MQITIRIEVGLHYLQYINVISKMSANEFRSLLVNIPYKTCQWIM